MKLFDMLQTWSAPSGSYKASRPSEVVRLLVFRAITDMGEGGWEQVREERE